MRRAALAVRCGALAAVLLLLLPPVAAAPLSDVEYDISYAPSDWSPQTLVNRASATVASTSQSDWPTDEVGIYLGSVTPETSLAHPHVIEEPAIAVLNVSWNVTFAAGDVGAGLAHWRLRLPVSVATATDADLSIVDPSGAAPNVSVPVLSVLTNATIWTGDRIYADLWAILYSGVDYVVSVSISGLAAADQPVIWVAPGDVASDGWSSLDVSVYDEVGGIPSTLSDTIAADAGASWLVIEGSPRSGYVGASVSQAAGASFALLWREDVPAPAGTVDVIVTLPIYTATGANGSYWIDVGINSISVHSGVVSIRDGWAIVAPSVATPLGLIDVLVTITALDAVADDYVVVARPSDDFVDAAVLLWDNASAVGEVLQLEPLFGVYVLNSTGSDAYTASASAPLVVEATIPRASTRYAGLLWSLVGATATVIQTATSCVSLAGCADDVVSAVYSGVSQTADDLYDYTSGTLALTSTIGAAVTAALSAGYTAIASFGESLIYTLRLAAETLAHWLSQIAVLLVYAGGGLLLLGPVIAAVWIRRAVDPRVSGVV